jgi:hypothetical protein
MIRGPWDVLVSIGNHGEIAFAAFRSAVIPKYRLDKGVINTLQFGLRSSLMRRARFVGVGIVEDRWYQTIVG